METKIIKQIEKICKADVDIKATILLEFSKAHSKVLKKFEETRDTVELFNELKIDGVFDFDSMILEYWGFEDTDDAVSDIIQTYINSSREDRMDIMKKELIEIILETCDSN
ncbi:hypothetical protein [Rossellomorea sp. NRS-1567]|uniref:hypothetical protein n=1 Tax=Rossellomorea sp. NRS-1567 TaxID=3233901 RepID=UPI003D2D959E